MSIFEYNGSALVAMVGKNCFAIASDRRLGVQLQTIATDFQKIYMIHDKLFIGLSGLGTDAQTLRFGCFGRYQRLVFRHKLYQLREERDMKPETFASLVSAILYEKRLVKLHILNLEMTNSSTTFIGFPFIQPKLVIICHYCSSYETS
ncbi:unnamed protein product [Ilex paraguariensis]|uniref:Proteasome subunit beta type-3 n=1 Tax=Ilex paraguariensis TaxID=185542 RepID=A0ABC8TMD7_9AQUA